MSELLIEQQPDDDKDLQSIAQRDEQPVVLTDEQPVVVLAKHCRVCGQDKPLSEFHALKTSADGYQRRCKSCATAAAAAWYQANRERILEHQKQYRESKRQQGQHEQHEHEQRVRDSLKDVR